jgi:hypothetical protein
MSKFYKNGVNILVTFRIGVVNIRNGGVIIMNFSVDRSIYHNEYLENISIFYKNGVNILVIFRNFIKMLSIYLYL